MVTCGKSAHQQCPSGLQVIDEEQREQCVSIVDCLRSANFMIILQTVPQTAGKSARRLPARAFLSRESRDWIVRLLLVWFTSHYPTRFLPPRKLGVNDHVRPGRMVVKQPQFSLVEEVGILLRLAVLPPFYLVSDLD